MGAGLLPHPRTRSVGASHSLQNGARCGRQHYGRIGVDQLNASAGAEQVATTRDGIGRVAFFAACSACQQSLRMAVSVAAPTCGVVDAIDTIFIGLLRPTRASDITPPAGHSSWVYEAHLCNRRGEYWLQRCSGILCAGCGVKHCYSRGPRAPRRRPYAAPFD